MSPETPAVDTSSFSRWFTRGLLLAVLLAAAIAVSPNVADPESLGPRRNTGGTLLQEGLARETTYSFTAAGHPWINHENLSELLMAIGADWGGPVGLMVGKCLLGVLVVALIMLAAWRQGVGLVVACMTPLLVAVNLSYHWSIRPADSVFHLFRAVASLAERGIFGLGRAMAADQSATA